MFDLAGLPHILRDGTPRSRVRAVSHVLLTGVVALVLTTACSGPQTAGSGPGDPRGDDTGRDDTTNGEDGSADGPTADDIPPIGIEPAPGGPLAPLVSAWRDERAPGSIQEIEDADRHYTPPETWTLADINGDGRDEWIAVVAPVACDRPPMLWIVGFEGRIARMNACAPLETCHGACRVVATGDVTGEGRADVVVEARIQGAHTETSLFRVFGIHHGIGPDPRPGLHSLVKADLDGDSPGSGFEDAVEMTYADVRLEDTTGEGVLDLNVSGGLVGSIGAGEHQRKRTEVWGMQRDRLRLLDVRQAPTDLRIFLLYDANAAMNEGELEEARKLYERVVTDLGLRDVENLYDEPTKPLVRQFAAFRLVLLSLMRDDAAGTGRWLDWFGSQAADTPIARAAETLADGWADDVDAACKAVTRQIEGEKMSWRPIMEMGYANPQLDAASLCPVSSADD